ncbi:MAG: pteridine reductase [Gammaproteobacteria bacterium]|nr:pteridine reductase [Gammaproteobacteria bacterium]
MKNTSFNNKVVLITGAARRIGATTVRALHDLGANIVLHFRSSADDATALADELNANREGSVVTIQADLLNFNALSQLASDAFACFGRLDILINNASSFYPTPLGDMSEMQFDNLMGSNLKAPLFLSQACYPFLLKTNGCIINMVDIHARSPLKNHTIYSCAKAANAMLVKSLAKEMGPDVRVNGVAPGAILWPENELDAQQMQAIIDDIPLQKTGCPQDIADTIIFLAQHHYINGQIIVIDGGRQLF